MLRMLLYVMELDDDFVVAEIMMMLLVVGHDIITSGNFIHRHEAHSQHSSSFSPQVTTVVPSLLWPFFSLFLL